MIEPLSKAVSASSARTVKACRTARKTARETRSKKKAPLAPRLEQDARAVGAAGGRRRRRRRHKMRCFRSKMASLRQNFPRPRLRRGHAYGAECKVEANKATLPMIVNI